MEHCEDESLLSFVLNFTFRHYVEVVERTWMLRAIDQSWQRHLVEMTVLSKSVQVRAFGQLDPMARGLTSIA